MDIKEIFELEYVEGELIDDEWVSDYYVITGVKDKNALPEEIFIPSWVEEQNHSTYIKKIGEGALRGLGRLKSVTIEGTTEIGEGAFDGCDNLKSITFILFLPKEIGADAFNGCNALCEVRIPETDEFCKIEFGNEYSNPVYLAKKFFVKDELQDDCLVIPESAEEINSYAFCGLKAKAVKFPSSVTEIRRCAFMECDELERVTLPPNVGYIDKFAFMGCTKLKSFTLSDKIRDLERSAFEGCTNLEYHFFNGIKYLGSEKNPYKAAVGAENISSSLTLHPDTEIICRGVFENRSDVAVFTANEGLRRITRGAFKGCTNLKKIYLPSTLEKVDEYAFEGCPIDEVHIPDAGAWCKVNFYIPFDCKSPNPVENATFFINGEVIENLVVPPVQNGVKHNTFTGCKTIKSLTVSNGVTFLGERAFAGCSSLESISIPNSVKRAGYGVFENCTSLKRVNLPPIESITAMFKGCTSLESAALSDGVKEFMAAFKNCTVLKTVILPSDLGKISDYSFEGCSSLERIEIPNGVTEIGRGAFEGCTALKSVIIPDGVTDIGMYAFKGCTSLEYVKFPKHLDVSDYAFEGCTSLKKIDSAEKFDYIGVNAFKGCASLTRLEIPYLLFPANRGAFEGCTSLKIIAPDDVWVKIKENNDVDK